MRDLQQDQSTQTRFILNPHPNQTQLNHKSNSTPIAAQSPFDIRLNSTHGFLKKTLFFDHPIDLDQCRKQATHTIQRNCIGAI